MKDFSELNNITDENILQLYDDIIETSNYWRIRCEDGYTRDTTAASEYCLTQRCSSCHIRCGYAEWVVCGSTHGYYTYNCCRF